MTLSTISSVATCMRVDDEPIVQQIDHLKLIEVGHQSLVNNS